MIIRKWLHKEDPQFFREYYEENNVFYYRGDVKQKWTTSKYRSWKDIEKELSTEFYEVQGTITVNAGISYPNRIYVSNPGHNTSITSIGEFSINTPTSTSKHKCRCEMRSLLMAGCKCGGI